MPPDDFSEKIELFVNDENRIITYKILSQELKIHVNKAKQYLMDFFNAQKAKGISLEAHYFLSGIIELDGLHTLKVVVVPEENLENVKKSFSKLISSHIYSVYKGASKDECALYSADFTYIKDKEEQNKYSAIRHPNIEIQPPVLNKIQVNSDIKSSLAKKQLHSPANDNSSLVPKNESKSKLIQSNVSPEKCDNSKEQTKDSKGNKPSPVDKNKKSGTLMSMWQKNEEKTNGIKKESLKAEKKGKEAAKVVPKNSIMSMFSKQAVKNAERPPASKDEGTPKTVVSETNLKKESPKKEKFHENKKTSHKRKASQKNSKESSKSKKDSDSENESQRKPKKKHRRICTFDDSDSESENEEEREKAQRSLFLPEDPMDLEMTPKTEDEEPIPPTPPVIHVKGRVKMWKTVQKTYEDEDGFLVTKTEKELVSASEDEEDPLKVNPVKKEQEVTKKCTSVNKKQASLMSFFKQK